jgi:hypothetical protein
VARLTHGARRAASIAPLVQTTEGTSVVKKLLLLLLVLAIGAAVAYKVREA